MQIVALPEPEHALPRQPRMLPQDVRVVRRPHLLAGPGPVSRGRVRADLAQAAVQEADL